MIERWDGCLSLPLGKREKALSRKREMGHNLISILLVWAFLVSLVSLRLGGKRKVWKPEGGVSMFFAWFRFAWSVISPFLRFGVHLC